MGLLVVLIALAAADCHRLLLYFIEVLINKKREKRFVLLSFCRFALVAYREW